MNTLPLRNFARALLPLLLCLFTLPALAQPSETDLLRAYKKEFAFLETERNLLKKRLEELDRKADLDLRAAERGLAGEEEELLRLGVRADDLADALERMEKSADTNMESVESLRSVFEQARHSLSAYKTAVPEFPEDPASAPIAPLFEKAAGLLSDLSRVRKEAGSFFLADGKQVEGELLRVGNVAGYGVSASGSGALAPAGEGRLRVWQEDAAESARALLDGRSPATLRIFLYDSLDKAVLAKESKSAYQVIESGGIIAWVIVILGCVALGMILLRTFFLFKSSSNTDDLMARLSPLIEQGWRDEAAGICKADRGATARVLFATIQNLRNDREQLENIISESILHEEPYLDRFGAIILVLAAVAPLLGLLGTVTGMISTFDIITEFGTGDPKLLSGGISEALVTTELGLIVAIPALLFGNLLSGWAGMIKAGMEHAALRISNIYARTGAGREEIARASTDEAAIPGDAS